MVVVTAAELVNVVAAEAASRSIVLFSVVVVVGRVAEKYAQRSLDAFCSSTGASSIKNAVESDKTLGGYAYDCRVTEMTNYTPIQLNEGTYLAAEFAVDVFAD